MPYSTLGQHDKMILEVANVICLSFCQFQEIQQRPLNVTEFAGVVKIL